VSQALAVAARELRERWLLFPAGLIVGLLPFLVPSFGLRPEQTPVVGLVLAVLLGAIAAFVAGASMLARDALDGRLAFLFSRPVPWQAIWGGKWLAAVVLAFGSAIFALVPVVLAYPPPSPAGAWSSVFLGPDGSGLFLVLLLLLGIGLANFNATAFRSRSAWLAVDLGFLLLAIWLTVRWVAPLHALLIPLYRSTSLRWIVLPGVPALALLLASVVQVWIGRTDLHRAHRALSVGFWGLIFVVLVTAGLRLAWARAATPTDLTAYAGGSSDPSGRWLYISGTSARGGAATFLIDGDRDRYVPMGVHGPMWWRLAPGMTFARDGGSGVILRLNSEHSALLHVDLNGAVPRFTDIELESSPPAALTAIVAVSASDVTVVLAHERGTSLYEIPSGRRIATATIPPGWRPAAVRFLGEQTVRVWLFPQLGLPYGSNPPAEMRILELGVDREPQTTSTALETVVDHVRSWPHLVHPDATGDRVLTHDGALRLRDGATGALIATLHEGPDPTSEKFLADGRIVVGTAVGSRPSLRIYSPEGAALGEMVLDGVASGSGLGVGSEVGPGRVRVSFGGQTLVVDLDERQVVETLPALSHLWSPSRRAEPEYASRTRHFVVKDGSIFRRDFATGEERRVAGPGARPGERLGPANLGLD
jgi:hypothetical protein